MANHNNELEKRLWEAADQLRANSALTAQEYANPVLGLIFLKYADFRFAAVHAELQQASRSGRRTIGRLDYQARGVLYLPESARFSYLINLPEGKDVGQAINNGMQAIEQENPELKDVLPRNYNIFENSVLVELLKIFNSIPMDLEGDVFGKIYEYFLGKFAMSEGRGGGEFYTPVSIVKLIVNIIEPFHGKIYDPACGSGGMFVQSARFVEEHQQRPGEEISIYGQESKLSTLKLAKLNLAVHGLSGDILQGNTYYEDRHDSPGQFDFVMANPPFNVDKVDKERLADDPRFPFGLPRNDNANYLWIQHFYSALNPQGRAGFVMANSASDARQSELEIRKQMIQQGAVDVVVAVSSNFFYTVTLPVTLWFLDQGKRGSDREDRVLFLDARHIYRQIDRAHREFTAEQIRFLADIVRLYRGEAPEAPEAQQRTPLAANGSSYRWEELFPNQQYQDVKGLCKIATRQEIEAQGWSLNPGRYVGVADGDEVDEIEFAERLEELHEELVRLNTEARDLENKIGQNISEILG